jgi:hypothetical protein
MYCNLVVNGRRGSTSVLTIPERAADAAASLRGRLRANNRRSKGEKGLGKGEKQRRLQHHQNMKPEQDGGRITEWELNRYCWQARQQQHGENAETGK